MATMNMPRNVRRIAGRPTGIATLPAAGGTPGFTGAGQTGFGAMPQQPMQQPMQQQAQPQFKLPYQSMQPQTPQTPAVMGGSKQLLPPGAMSALTVSTPGMPAPSFGGPTLGSPAPGTQPPTITAPGSNFQDLFSRLTGADASPQVTDLIRKYMESMGGNKPMTPPGTGGPSAPNPRAPQMGGSVYDPITGTESRDLRPIGPNDPRYQPPLPGIDTPFDVNRPPVPQKYLLPFDPTRAVQPPRPSFGGTGNLPPGLMGLPYFPEPGGQTTPVWPPPGGNIAPPRPAPPVLPMGLQVENLYQQYLGRGSDPEGLKFWQDKFGSEIDQSEIDQFKAEANKELGNRPMPVPRPPIIEDSIRPDRPIPLPRPPIINQPVKPFPIEERPVMRPTLPFKPTQPAPVSNVQDLYRQYLGRDADPGGLKFWQEKFGSEIDPGEIQQFLEGAKPELTQRNPGYMLQGRQGFAKGGGIGSLVPRIRRR